MIQQYNDKIANPASLAVFPSASVGRVCRTLDSASSGRRVLLVKLGYPYTDEKAHDADQPLADVRLRFERRRFISGRKNLVGRQQRLDTATWIEPSVESDKNKLEQLSTPVNDGVSFGGHSRHQISR